jgi:hypothetical protein
MSYYIELYDYSSNINIYLHTPILIKPLLIACVANIGQCDHDFRITVKFKGLCMKL